jgi:hypothetical protein
MRSVPVLRLRQAYCVLHIVCALNGKFNKSSFIMLSFIKESPEGVSPFLTKVLWVKGVMTLIPDEALYTYGEA